MGKVKAEGTLTQRQELNMGLFDPGMTALHRVGLAGLWMTLKQFEKERVRIHGGTWSLTSEAVTLRWEGKPRKFFESLFKHSFKINKNGLLWFPALGDPMDNPQAAVLLHNAILGTFLQHGKTRRADPSNKPTGVLSVKIDDHSITFGYQKLKRYAHQTAYEDFIGHDGTLRIATLAGWHVPGGAVRHVGLGEAATALKEPPERLIPLLYGPVGGIYFQIRQRAEGVRPLYALVLPEINDLEKYASARAIFRKRRIEDLLASGTAEAGWRVLAVLHAKKVLSSLDSPACRVISFGTVPWSKQQKTRVDLLTVRPGTEESLRIFNLCLQVFPPILIKPERGEPFWDVAQVPDLIARNLTDGRSWYQGFADLVSKSAFRDHVFKYEKGGLGRMVKEVTFDNERERIFIRACHEAWRRRLGQLGERARREGASFPDLARREFERLRVGFTRCKNAASLRGAVTDFWARAGSALPDLTQGWEEVLPLLDDSNWRKARDLALLALASYPSSSENEA